MQVKIILILVALLILIAGSVYYTTSPDKTAAAIEKMQEDQSKAADHVYSDYTHVGKTKPIEIPGNGSR